MVIEAVPAGPQFLKSPQEAPAGAPEPIFRSRGAVRTNVPTNIRVVDHLDHRDHRRPQVGRHSVCFFCLRDTEYVNQFVTS